MACRCPPERRWGKPVPWHGRRQPDSLGLWSLGKHFVIFMAFCFSEGRHQGTGGKFILVSGSPSLKQRAGKGWAERSSTEEEGLGSRSGRKGSLKYIPLPRREGHRDSEIRVKLRSS